MRRTSILVALISLFCSNAHSQQPVIGNGYEIEDETFKTQEALLEKEFQRLRKTLELGKDSAPAAFDEAKEIWLKFRSRYCFAISQAFGGNNARRHDLRCQKKIAEDFIKEMQGRTW